MKLEIGSGMLIFLTCILCILKVANCINIPWLWVFCPIWIPVALIGIFLAFILFLLVLSIIINTIK